MAQDKTAAVQAAAKDAGKSAKTAAKNTKPSKPGLFARLGSYFSGVRSELKRVVWPGRQEVINSTIIVLVTLVFFAVLTSVVGAIASGAITALYEIGG